MPEVKKSTYTGQTDARRKASAKYLKESVEDIRIRVPKGQKDVVRSHSDKMGESMNAFVLRAINEAMERDNQSPGASPKAIPSEPAPMYSEPDHLEEEPFPSPLASGHSLTETESGSQVPGQSPVPERPKADTVGKYTERLEQLRKETLSAMNGQGQHGGTGTVSRSGGRNADSLPPLNRESLDAKLERLHREHSQKSE